MKIILYKDRNKIDIRINEAINSIIYFLHNNMNKRKYKIKEHDAKLERCDVAIMFGIESIHKQNTNHRKRIREFQKNNNNLTLIIELGFIKRDIYYSCGFNNIVGFGHYINHDMPKDRYDRLNIKLKNTFYRTLF